MAPDPLPTYVYKIIPSAPVVPLPAEYPPSDLDKQDGFIHLSNAVQIPKTADLFFAETPALWIIKIRLAGLEEKTKWEGDCAHLFGNFGAANVESSQKFERSTHEKWSEAMNGSTWLE